MEREPWEYTLREVAALTGVSVDTVKRRLRTGAFPNARQMHGPVGTWLVPLADISKAGLTLRGAPSASRPRNSLDAAANRDSVAALAATMTDPPLAQVEQLLDEIHDRYAALLRVAARELLSRPNACPQAVEYETSTNEAVP